MMRYVALLGLVIACGGSDKPVDHPEGAGNTTNAQDSGPPSTVLDASGGTTTTTTLLTGDAGELQGTKLTTTQNPATFDGGSNTTARPNATDRDPGRTVQDLATIIQLHRAEARACYDTALKAHPGIRGNLDITWKLDPKGAVVETGVDDSKSDIHEPTLVKCIGDVIRKINWAPSPRGFETNARYPFNFVPH